MHACEGDIEVLSVKRLQDAIKMTDEAIEYLWAALERGQAVDTITERLNKREAEKKQLELQLAKEKAKLVQYDRAHILAFLQNFRDLPDDHEMKRRSIINVSVNSVYLYDDHFLLILNTEESRLTVDNIPFGYNTDTTI